MKKLSIANLKGGTGKTTTATELAVVSANGGARVLVLDNDQQGNASQFFFVFNKADNMTAGGLLMEDDFSYENVKAFVKHTADERIDVIASNKTLAMANKLAPNTSFEKVDFIQRYREALSVLEEDYDLCIIDNGPSMCPSLEASLIAADYVVIPADPSKYSYTGLQQLMDSVKAIQFKKNPNLEVLGVLITKYRDTALYNEGVKYLKAENVPVLDTKIRYSMKVDSSTYAGESLNSLFKHSPRSNPSKDYKELAAELLSKMGMKWGAENE